jgi:hypothetical protein
MQLSWLLRHSKPSTEWETAQAADLTVAHIPKVLHDVGGVVGAHDLDLARAADQVNSQSIDQQKENGPQHAVVTGLNVRSKHNSLCAPQVATIGSIFSTTARAEWAVCTFQQGT